MRKTIQAAGKLWLLILLVGMVMSAQVYATEGTQPESEEQGTTDNAAKSGDNSLSSLSISPGTLSPAFQYNNTNYTASVSEDVTSVEVNAKTSNEKAVVESISGNADLKQGENTISIIVKAENGVVATYKIVVTRGGATAPEEAPQETGETGEDASQENGETGEDASQTPETNGNDASGITINEHPFDLAPVIPEDAVPQDFTKITVDCQGQQVEGLKFDKGALTLVYLTTPSTEVKNTLAVYEETSNKLYPFRKVQLGESNYLILLDPPAETGLSQEYTQATQTMGGFENVPVFVRSVGGAASKTEDEKGNTTADSTEFSLVYGISSFGNIGWYQYDTVESSFQRLSSIGESKEEQGEEQEEEPSVEMKGLQNAYKDLEEQYNKKKDSSRKTTAVMIFIIAVLVVVIINLIIRGRKDEEEDLDEPEEREPKLRFRKRFQKIEDSDDQEPKFGKRSKKTEKPEDQETKPRARKRAQMKMDEENEFRDEGTVIGKTVTQETRPMYKHEKKHTPQGGLSKGAATNAQRRLSEAMTPNVQNRPLAEAASHSKRKTSETAAPNARRRLPEEGLPGVQKRPSTGTTAGGQRRPSQAAIPSGQRRTSEAVASGQRRPLEAPVPNAKRRPSEAALDGQRRSSQTAASGNSQRRSAETAMQNPQRRPSVSAAPSGQRRPSETAMSNPQRRPPEMKSPSQKGASTEAAPSAQRRPPEAAAPSAQRRPSEAAAPNPQRRPSEAATPNPQRRPSEAAAPNPQRRPSEAAPNPQRRPPEAAIAAEPHGNPSILSEELDDEFEVIDLEDL